MKKSKVLWIFVLFVVMLGIIGVLYAATCPPPIVVDPEILPFPVDTALINHRLLGGVVVMAENVSSTTLTACDSDGDPLVFSATNMPTGMALDTSTNVLSWIPTTDQIGTYYVDVKVEDQPDQNAGNPYPPNTPSLSDEGTVIFRVYRSNLPPILLTLP